MRALELLGLADAYGNARVPLYVLNVTYPLVDDEFVALLRAARRAMLIVEEGQPEFIEQARQHDPAPAPTSRPRLDGKDVLPMAGEYTGAVMRDGVEAFVRKYRPDAASDAPPPNERSAHRRRHVKTLERPGARRGRRRSAPAVRSGRSSPR